MRREEVEANLEVDTVVVFAILPHVNREIVWET